MSKEQIFFDSLRDIFVGAKVEGESGYINLMRIKSKYFSEGVFPRLKKDIDEALKPFPEFREELFDKLYTFFKRYFSESGSIYFNYTPIYQNVYEKVYTDDDDVILFWKTHMLYYVKTDRLFNSLPVEFEGFKFFFDVSTLEHKKAMEKREIVYEFKEKKSDGTIVFNVYYSEKGRQTKIDEIIRACRREGVKIDEDILLRAFRVFEKQSEVDYFINKNAREFLREQFNLWLYQYVFSGESEWTEKRIKQLQVLQNIAFKIIDFISQFEDELVKIWNKPKFVLNSNYVITLDRIASKDIQLVEKIVNHPKFEEQVKEWKELEIVGDTFSKNEIFENAIVGKRLKEDYQHLPIDTKYFKDLELEILSLFNDLDNALDGWLIKSENYQALNTILSKFREKVQTIYIDPPFNKEQDADYFYNVKYKDATWITLLENRLWLAKDLLNKKGSIFVRCDDNGNMYVRLLMNKIFGKQNFQNEIVIKTSGIQKEAKIKFLDATESLFFYAKNQEDCFFKELYEERETGWQPFVHYPGIRAQEKPWRVAFGVKLPPPEGRHWGIKQELINLYLPKKLVRFRCKNCGYEHYEGRWGGCPKCGMNDFIPEIKNPPKKVDSNWTNIQSYSQDPDFPTRNAEELIQRVFEATSNEGDLVMDFFLGSGTATAVAHKMRRKWIGVEMGEHFYTKVLPRMKKVLSGEQSGISKQVNWQGGGFFKYYELEQYEDTLRRMKYEDSSFFENPYEDPYNQYVFMRDAKMLEALEIDYQNNKVKVDLNKLYRDIDIAETLSNLLGKWIKKITPNYVEFDDGERINTKELDYRLIKPLIWW
jgi:adenine specific DNA methylase Mod